MLRPRGVLQYNFVRTVQRLARKRTKGPVTTEAAKDKFMYKYSTTYVTCLQELQTRGRFFRPAIVSVVLLRMYESLRVMKDFSRNPFNPPWLHPLIHLFQATRDLDRMSNNVRLVRTSCERVSEVGLGVLVGECV